jgi:hypothetical protein
MRPDYTTSGTKVRVYVLKDRSVCKVLTLVCPIVKLPGSIVRRNEILQQGKTVGLTKWQGTQQQCVHYAKHSRICADAEGKRKDGNGRYAWGFAEHADAEM